MLKQNTDFSQGSVSGNIVSLAIPMTLAQLVNVLYNIVDRVYIGHIPEASSLALTGIGLCFPITTLIQGFSALFGQGGAPLFNMSRGAGDEERAGKIMGNVFTLIVSCGLILTLICYLVKKPLLYAFGASDDTFFYANQYLEIYLIGLVFVMITLGMNQFINSQGFGRTGMFTILIGAILNIILDPIFIFVFNMGVRGAAIATVISQFASALFIIRFLLGKKTLIKLSTKDMKLDLPLVGRICGLGTSNFVMSFTTCAVQVVCNKTLSIYGGDLYVGVMTVINSVRETLLLPISGLSSASPPVISFNYGAKLYDRVRKAILFQTLVGVIYTAIAWLIVFLLPSQIVRIFNDDPALIAAAVPSIHTYFFGFFMMSLQFSGQNSFVALGKSRFAIFFSLLRKAFIVIPLTLLLPGVGNLGVRGVFLAEPISNFVGGAACFITMMITVFRQLAREERELSQK